MGSGAAARATEVLRFFGLAGGEKLAVPKHAKHVQPDKG